MVGGNKIGKGKDYLTMEKVQTKLRRMYIGEFKKKSTFTAKTDVKRKELQIKTGAGEMAWSAECLRSKHREQCHLSCLQSQGWG